MSRALPALLLSLAACAPYDVVVADQPPLDDGGRPPPAPPCTTNLECPPDGFCDKPSCDALNGHCHPRPKFCDGVRDVRCGCNGVTYWNDCLRRAQGVAASTPDECSEGISCTTRSQCPDPEASCALLLPPSAECTATPLGACWVVPRVCPTPVPGDSAWDPCMGSDACASLCGAIRTGVAHRRSTSCP